jgi:hypothetical protein
MNPRFGQSGRFLSQLPWLSSELRYQPGPVKSHKGNIYSLIGYVKSYRCPEHLFTFRDRHFAIRISQSAFHLKQGNLVPNLDMGDGLSLY